MEMPLCPGAWASRQLVGLGVQPVAPAPDGGSLEKAITTWRFLGFLSVLCA